MVEHRTLTVAACHALIALLVAMSLCGAGACLLDARLLSARGYTISKNISPMASRQQSPEPIPGIGPGPSVVQHCESLAAGGRGEACIKADKLKRGRAVARGNYRGRTLQAVGSAQRMQA